LFLLLFLGNKRNKTLIILKTLKMINNNIRAKAWKASQELKKEFKEVGDRQGEQLFATTELILAQDTLFIQRFLDFSMSFIQDELAKMESSQN